MKKKRSPQETFPTNCHSTNEKRLVEFSGERLAPKNRIRVYVQRDEKKTIVDVLKKR